MRSGVFSVFCLLLMYSCAPVRFVKPLAKKEQAVNLSLGGPLIKFSSLTIPMPFVTATYGYGIDSTLTAFGAVNITSALYGNAQVDLGVTKQLFYQHNYVPSISITPSINVIYRNVDAKKLYPQLAINAFWEYGKKKNFVYTGIDNWFELASKRSDGSKQNNHWIFMPMLGHSFSGKKWNFNMEIKVIAPTVSNQKLVVGYVTPLKTHGAFGVYFGFTRKF